MIAIARRARDVVQDHEHAAPIDAREAIEQREHAHLVMSVKVIDGLVVRTAWGVLAQQCRDRDAPAFPAGQGPDKPRLETRHVHRGERRHRTSAVVFTFPPPAFEMRVAADEHRVQHGAGKGIVLQ